MEILRIGDFMHKKKKLENRYYIIIILIVIVLFLTILFFMMKDKRKLSLPEQALKDAYLFTQKMVNIPIHFLTDKINEAKEKNQIYEKYQKLLSQKEQIEALEAKNKEIESELQEMKALLELNRTLVEASYINATIIVRNIDSWNQTIVIDKGKLSGMEENMAVVTNHGLIGTITHTSYFSSTVQLLTSVDTNHKISVKIEGENGYIYGLLSGYDIKNHCYQIEGIAENTEIPLGAHVVSTGLGNDIPSGILIGTVKEVKTDHFDLARTVLVEASVNFDDMRFVTVLKKGENS